MLQRRPDETVSQLIVHLDQAINLTLKEDTFRGDIKGTIV